MSEKQNRYHIVATVHKTIEIIEMDIAATSQDEAVSEAENQCLSDYSDDYWVNIELVEEILEDN